MRRRPLSFEVDDHVFSESVSLERDSTIWEEREIGAKIYWAISDYWEGRKLGISVGTSALISKCTSGIPCFNVKEV